MPKAVTRDAPQLTISEPRFVIWRFRIRGTAPYVQLKFSGKAREHMLARQLSASKKREPKQPRNLEEDFRNAMHIGIDASGERFYGIPCNAFRAAMIEAAVIVGATKAMVRRAVFVEADGFDADEVGLVRLLSEDFRPAPDPVMHQATVRNATGVADVRVRPMWRQWGAIVQIKFDADLITGAHVTNLLARAGVQIGIGEGRPASKESAGMGWGTFEIVHQQS